MTTQPVMLNEVVTKKWARFLLLGGMALLVLSVLIEFTSMAAPFQMDAEHGGLLKRYLHSYLFSFVFFMSLVFGSFFFVVLQFLTKAGWSVVVRRIPETVMKNIEVMIPLSIPVLVGVFTIFEWTHTEVVANDHILQVKEPYLNITFFFIRVVAYFVFMFLAVRYYYLNSIFQDLHPSVEKTKKMQRYSPVATFIFAITITLFAIDFMMSLFPHWYSTIWGVYYFAGSMIASLCFISIVGLVLRKMGHLKNIITKEHYHDIGKLIFSFNVFWAYIAFSQYMLIWYANIPEETLFYIDRINGSWFSVSLFLAFGHVVLPLFAFISRNAKRHLTINLLVSVWLLFMHAVDMYWIVLPVVDVQTFALHISDVVIFLGMGGVFVGYFLKNFGSHSIVAHQDPYYEESVRFENA